MSHNKLFSIIAFLSLLVACASKPVEDLRGNDGGKGGSAGNGGAGGDTGGSGGEQGGASGGGGDTGGQGGTAGEGGQGGSAPEFVFNCTDVAANEVAIKFQSPIKPNGHLAVDGEAVYPPNQGFANIWWQNLLIEPDAESATTVLDLGGAPSGSKFQFYPGISTDGVASPNPNDPGHNIAVDTGMCSGSTCSNLNILCCWGGKVIGKVEDGKVSDGLIFVNGVNPTCETPK